MPTAVLPIPVLDHVIINARDQLDQAAALYAGLGFQLTPRGHHTLGSVNNLAILGNDYIELLGVPQGGARTDVLDWPAGLNGLAFKTLDSDATFAALADAGLPALPPQAFSRPVDMGRPGPHPDAAFRTVRLQREATPAGRLFFCQHLTPELVWHDPWRRHANGALGLLGAILTADDPAVLGTLFARMFGPDAVRPTPHGCALLAGLATVEVVTPAVLAARLGDAAPVLAGRAQAMAALVVRTGSLARVREAVPHAQAAEGGLLIPASAAGGTALIFRE